MRLALTGFAITLFLIIAFSCAKQTSPTGGPKDSIPPKLVPRTPPMKTTNFKGNTIELQFDETVIVNNPREQLLISPSVGKDVEMTARKKTVTLKINSPLQENTTYTINFRESIQDITEKNPAENLQLAFSTGDYLDSLKIQGSVYNATTGDVLDDATVAIYSSDTFNIFEDTPSYLTKTSKKGNFSLEHLKAGTYYIYALNDNNKNITVDSKSESYGFITKPFELLTDTAQSFSIPIVKLDARELKLISARPYNTYFNIKASKSLTSFSVIPQNPADSARLYPIKAEDPANVKVYAPGIGSDSIAVQFQAQDSIGFTIDTLVYVKLQERKATPEKFNFTIDKPKIESQTGILTTELSYTKPISFVNYDSIKYQLDSLTSYSLTQENFSWETKTGKGKLSLTVDKTLLTSETPANQLAQAPAPTSLINKLTFGRGAFVSIENDSSSKYEQTPNILKPDNTGIIIVEANTSAPNFITQLLTSDLKPVDSTHNRTNTVFHNIIPGNYVVRLIIDTNANGKWDPGNFYKKEEPEQIIFYRNEEGNKTINLKANWELGPLLINTR